MYSFERPRTVSITAIHRSANVKYEYMHVDHVFCNISSNEGSTVNFNVLILPKCSVKFVVGMH